MRRIVLVLPLAAAVLASSATGCSSSPSPKSQLLHQMHKLTPNTPNDDIVSDADVVCMKSATAARRFLLTDSMAAINGMNGLSVGPPASSALTRYVDRIITVAHDVHYC